MLEQENFKAHWQRVDFLNQLATRLLQSVNDYDEMVDVIVQRSLEQLKGDWGFLVLFKPGEMLDFKVVLNWSREQLEAEEEPLSRSILDAVRREKKPLLVEDAMGHPEFKHSAINRSICSVLAAPLTVDNDIVGALYLESSSMERLFGPEQFQLFQKILELSSKILEICAQRRQAEERNSLLERDLLARYHFPGIVTQDPRFMRILKTVAQASDSELPILVQGPSGSGKELIIRALHVNSQRAKRPFQTINCGAISPNLLESELFGHVRGAFTGATHDKIGLILSADTGTVFLDEVGDLPKDLQVKLLRTLQFGELQPVGSVQVQKVDVRFLAATNKNLQEEANTGRFREDLFYRLNAITIELPPLKERSNDILPLFDHFLSYEAAKAKRPKPEATPRLERVLQRYGWPGNVREVENEARRLFALTPPGVPLTVDRLSNRIRKALQLADPGELAEQDLSTMQSQIAFDRMLAENEREIIELCLRSTGWNRTQAAKRLGMARETLRQKIKRYGLVEEC